MRISLSLMAASAAVLARPVMAGAQSRDSGGVRIVENRNAVWKAGQGWKIETTPALVIGDAGGDSAYRFGGIEGALRLSDGRIVIANRSTSELRYFDAAGKFLFAAGGRGRAAGELGYIAGIQRCGGDSVWVEHMPALGMVQSVFSPAGKHVRTFALKLVDGGQSYRSTCERDGRHVAIAWDKLPTPTSPGAWRPNVPLSLTAPDGTLLRKLGEVPGDERHSYQMEDGTMGGSSPRPLGKRFAIAGTKDGFFMGAGDRYEIAAYDSAGKLRTIIRRDFTPIRVDSTLLGDAKRELIAESPREADRWELFFEDMDIPRRLPPYHEIRADASGNLWVNEYVRPGADARWSIFRPDGVFLGTLTIPKRFRVMDIGDDFLLVVEKTGKGEVVQLLRLRKEPAT
jgi:hypothetical protein